MIVKFVAEEVAVRMMPSKAMAVISITNPGDHAPLKLGWGAMLRTSFADAQYNEESILFAEKLWPISSKGFMTKAHAITIREFIASLDSSISVLIVHCGAGVSRSAAVAHYAAQHFGTDLDGDMSKLNTTVLRLLTNPCVFDELLPVPVPKESFFSAISRKIGQFFTIAK